MIERVKNIRIEDFDYPLPDERIALHPLKKRDACKLITAGALGKISHHIFSDLPLLIKPGTLIIANETKVIRARMEFVKETGAKIEIFLLEPVEPHDYVTNFASTASCSWVCLVGNKKRWKEGLLSKNLSIPGGTVILQAELLQETEGNSYEIRFSWDNPSVSFAEIVESAGNMPIPPYLKRESEESDITDYQTVYSHTEGSVAAPTAGLHFTEELFDRLRKHGDEFDTVTLHVGAGTFQPVKSEEIGGHPMHTEWISVKRSTIVNIIHAIENGRDILAVGTTSVRTLESLPYLGVQMKVTQWMPYEKRLRDIDTIQSLKNLVDYMALNDLDAIETTTSIMIAPGFRWRIVNRLITNFHQPKSTLLLLVSSFLGACADKTTREAQRWREIYDEALAKDYRFLSYGDACLFTRAPQPVDLPLSKSMAIRKATIEAVKAAKEGKGEFDRGAVNGGQPYNTCDDIENYLNALQQTLRSATMPEGRLMLISIGEGAAPLRFLTAFAASLPGAKIKIVCGESLQKRPISPLISALKEIGADIEFEDSPHWQIMIKGRKLKGGSIEVDSSLTSQFVSALLLASPLWEKAEVKWSASLNVSKPYLRMTELMMENPNREMETDWSAAAFFYEHALISRKDRLEISRLTTPSQSLQGDAAVCDIYSELGVNTEFHPDGSATLTYDRERYELLRERGKFEFDFSDYPDIVPSITVALCYRQIPFHLHGIGHLQHKESNRLVSLQILLGRIGYEVETDGTSLFFNGEFKPMEALPVEIEPYGDHRIAMAFYPLELLGIVKIEDKSVITKSFPNFYQQFK